MTVKLLLEALGYTPLGSRLLVVGVLVVALAACGQQGGAGLSVEGAWARPSRLAQAAEGTATPATVAMAGGHTTMAAPGATSAAYMTIRNGGREDDRLVGARTEAARTVELHQTTLDGGMMRMRPVEAIEIPAGGAVELKPGGYHLMLFGLPHELRSGDRLTITLQFAHQGAVTVTAEVRQP